MARTTKTPHKDGDGISDGDEVMNGTDPNVPTTDLSVSSGPWVQLLFAAMLAVIGAHMARRTRYSI